MSRRRKFAVVWVVLLGLPLGLELYGLFSAGDWDMSSEHVIPWIFDSQARWISTLIMYIAAALWLGWHWWLQYRDKYPKREDRPWTPS